MSWPSVKERMGEALMGAVLLFLLGIFAGEFGDLSYIQTQSVHEWKWWIATTANVLGLMETIYFAGILFGSIGFIYEYHGASLIIKNPQVDLLNVAIGTFFIVVGRPIWQGLKEILSS